MAFIIITLIILIVIAIGAIFWFISTMNRFERLAVKISESDSGIDVALIKRFDTLSKMLDVTKGYAKHEAETLSKIVALRKGMSMNEKIEATNKMDEITGRINVLVESYPDLKASDNFRELQRTIVEVEDHLQAARRIYNMNVSSFNQLLVSFPASLVGRAKGHILKQFFEAEKAKKEDVSMSF
jgi:LemA protein